MIQKSVIPIDIHTSGESDFVATITAYIPDGGEEKKPAVIIFPGGAYKVVAQYEGAPTAKKYADMGFAAFVVQYSCMPAVFPQSLCEGLWSVRYVRTNADKYGIDPDNITVMGFSAGGHLAASLGTLLNLPILDDYLGTDREDCRPNKLVLCYPVISCLGEFHRDSFVNLLGSNGFADEKKRQLVSLENQVSDDTPPTFIWHGFADSCVPVSGTLRFVEALVHHRVPTEFHMYPFADHGGGLNRGRYHEDWSDKAAVFMRDDRLRITKK